MQLLEFENSWISPYGSLRSFTLAKAPGLQRVYLFIAEFLVEKMEPEIGIKLDSGNI